MSYQKIQIPTQGRRIEIDSTGALSVPWDPIIPYIEGDGIGIDITPVMKKVVDAAVLRAYHGQRRIEWLEIFAGEKAMGLYGECLPQETLKALKEFKVGIKGPLTTPVGGGIRSINVALRQQLDLYVCLRPVRYFEGAPSPVKHPEQVDMVIFRENSEDIYAGIEWEAGSEASEKIIRFLKEEMKVTQIRFTDQCGIGVKPVSKAGTERLVRRAIQYAIEEDKPSVTVVHKGNIMKYTEGAFKIWAYELAAREFGAIALSEGQGYHFQNPRTGRWIVIKDVIADAFLQQILLRPSDYSVIATLNLNGDYISDALAAEVGGIGIAPGANLSDEIGLFEATHGTAPKHAGLNRANPGSLLLSAEMMLRHLGWHEGAQRIIQGIEKTLASHQVTYDFERQMSNATLVSCSEFGEAVIQNM